MLSKNLKQMEKWWYSSIGWVENLIYLLNEQFWAYPKKKLFVSFTISFFGIYSLMNKTIIVFNIFTVAYFTL